MDIFIEYGTDVLVFLIRLMFFLGVGYVLGKLWIMWVMRNKVKKIIGFGRTSLKDMMKTFSPERQKEIKDRAKELIGEEKARRDD